VVRPSSASTLVPFNVAPGARPELDDGGQTQCHRARSPTGREASDLLTSIIQRRYGAGERGGLVAWQPPHRQDEDLVPLTAGACFPRRGGSPQVSRQHSARCFY